MLVVGKGEKAMVGVVYSPPDITPDYKLFKRKVRVVIEKRWRDSVN